MDETTAEFLTEDIAPSVPLRVTPRVTVAAKTDMGRVRENNEDKYEYFLAEHPSDLAGRGHVFVCCDGMGGHEAGQFASELAAKTFIDVYRNHPAREPQDAALAAVQAANRFILDVGRAVPSRKGMGTTMTNLLLVQDKAYVAHAGDSRLYRLREGQLEQLTMDHTWVEETVAAGMMSREEAENHPYRHVITRALGTDAALRPDIFETDVLEGDLFLLCTDGVTNHVTDERLLAIMATSSPSETAWKVVGEALVGGGSDNATVIVVRIDALEAVSVDDVS